MSKVALPEASRRLGVAYLRCWNAITSGTVPAERAGGRILVAEADLPALAEALGVTWEPPADAPKRRRHAA